MCDRVMSKICCSPVLCHCHLINGEMTVACLAVSEYHYQREKRERERDLSRGKSEDGKRRFTTLIGQCTFILRILLNGILLKATVAE